MRIFCIPTGINYCDGVEKCAVREYRRWNSCVKIDLHEVFIEQEKGNYIGEKPKCEPKWLYVPHYLHKDGL